jgi:hypothetical protein
LTRKIDAHFWGCQDDNLEASRFPVNFYLSVKLASSHQYMMSPNWNSRSRHCNELKQDLPISSEVFA